MNRFAVDARRDRQILAFDPTGRGRVAEVFGDLDRAERVSVVVPGVDTNLLTFERTELKQVLGAGRHGAVAVRAPSTRRAPARVRR